MTSHILLLSLLPSNVDIGEGRTGGGRRRNGILDKLIVGTGFILGALGAFKEDSNIKELPSIISYDITNIKYYLWSYLIPGLLGII